MILGKHVSIANGIDRAPYRARELGCNALQIFAKNPRGWNGRRLEHGEADKVKDILRELDMCPLVVHATYLINIASPKRELWDRSIESLADDYQRAGKLGADFLVVHPGSHTGSGIEAGIKRIIEAINIVLGNVENNTLLLLENVAGAGTTIGSRFEQLNEIINGIADKKRTGICLDTCHALAAGYDLASSNGLNRMLVDFNSILGLDRLKVIHINDSKHPLASHKDEHVHIGDGYIGREGMARIINHPDLYDLPFILETPPYEGKDLDVEMILSLRN
jgi:deoxyribonuclease IV